MADFLHIYPAATKNDKTEQVPAKFELPVVFNWPNNLDQTKPTVSQWLFRLTPQQLNDAVVQSALTSLFAANTKPEATHSLAQKLLNAAGGAAYCVSWVSNNPNNKHQGSHNGASALSTWMAANSKKHRARVTTTTNADNTSTVIDMPRVMVQDLHSTIIAVCADTNASFRDELFPINTAAFGGYRSTNSATIDNTISYLDDNYTNFTTALNRGLYGLQTMTPAGTKFIYIETIDTGS